MYGSEAVKQPTLICDVVFGDVSPSGKLTTTFPKNVGQIPLYYNHLNTGRPLEAGKWFSKFRSNYLDIDNDPLYPFGYGLSYTTFRYGDLQLSNNSMNEKGKITASVTVTNTGSAAGKDVVEIYNDPPYTNGGIEKASANLLDFAKTGELAPGESETIDFTIPVEDLASYDYKNNGCYVLEAGDYIISTNSDAPQVLDSKTYMSLPTSFTTSPTSARATRSWRSTSSISPKRDHLSVPCRRLCKLRRGHCRSCYL